MLFVIALRNLGAARASAYYGIAPFVGVAVAFLLLGERPDVTFWAAAALMAGGIWLHLTERHGHPHAHDRFRTHMRIVTMDITSTSTRSRGMDTSRTRIRTTTKRWRMTTRTRRICITATIISGRVPGEYGAEAVVLHLVPAGERRRQHLRRHRFGRRFEHRHPPQRARVVRIDQRRRVQQRRVVPDRRRRRRRT